MQISSSLNCLYPDLVAVSKLSLRQGVYYHFSFYFDSLESTRQQLCKSGELPLTESYHSSPDLKRKGLSLGKTGL